VGCGTQEAEAGFGTRKKDLGSRRVWDDGMWGAEAGFRGQIWDGGAGEGLVGPRSTAARAQPCTGILQHPRRRGVRATSREM